MNLDVSGTASLITGGLAAVLVICCCVGGTTIYKSDNKTKAKVFCMVAFVVFCVAAEIAATILTCLDGQSAATITLIKIFKRVAIVAEFLFFVSASINLLSVSDNVSRVFKACKTAFGITGAAMAVFFVVDLFAGMAYLTVPGGLWQRGSLFWISGAAELLILAIDLFFLIKNRKKISKQQFPFFITICAILAVCTILWLFFAGIPFFFISVILSVVCFAMWEHSVMKAVIKEKQKIILNKDKEIVSLHNIIMRRQVSPHFIYNALTAIRAIDGNPEQTKQAIGDFAKYLRYNLGTMNERQVVPFEKELEHIKAYLRVEQVRFGSELQVIFEIRVVNFVVPQMAVQMLVENAVKHGVSAKQGGGMIRIVSTIEGDNVKVCVIDDGVGYDADGALDDSHVGLNNLRKRLEYILKGRLEIKSKKGEGTTATIIIPKSTSYSE